MKGIIEAGVVLLIVYLFLQWEKNGGAAGPSIANGIDSIFKEAPGSPTQGLINESAMPGTAGNTAQSTTSATAGSSATRTGGCGCGGC
jgi:hypothetical protein